jgi:RNA polymerase sigma factor (sigma-70 family)
VPVTEDDESQLLKAAMQHDIDAFGALVSLHQARVRGFLRRLCRDHASADDLAQESFLLAWRKLKDYRAQGSFNAWLCSIAYRCFLQSRRSHKREVEMTQLYGLQHCADETDEAQPLLQRTLERAMATLSGQEAAAITLNITLGYSHSEVATILELPLGTVKSLIARGLPKLRAVLTHPATGENHEHA